MGKGRLGGAGKQVTGSIKEAVGKVTGDKKIEAEGRAEKLAGKAGAAATQADGTPPETIADAKK